MPVPDCTLCERSKHTLNRTSTTRFVVSTPVLNVLNGECTKKRELPILTNSSHCSTLHCGTMSLRSGSTVFKLSNEVLAQIFQHFVDKAWPRSPVVLTHVCQLWRQLVQSTSSFWKFIDLSFLQRVERAEHHFAFAQEQLLVVNWQNAAINATWHRKKPSNLDKYERIFAQASRFTDLSLLFHGQDIVELFDRFSHHELSNLRSLKVAAMPWSEDPFTPGCMPNLRHLILS